MKLYLIFDYVGNLLGVADDCKANQVGMINDLLLADSPLYVQEIEANDYHCRGIFSKKECDIHHLEGQ